MSATYKHPDTVTLGGRTLTCDYTDAHAKGTLHVVCDLVGPGGSRGAVVHDLAHDRLTLLGARFCSLDEERATLAEAFREGQKESQR